ncbi:hypothetical protein [Phaeacidiphilus oryzae]|uniref:hypothetical protein n=1 Tax=Phaeacidiphilus oryzae TaxID=348818 RepID=UPI00068F6178|nr:hypothetical protein [Phaeacidiphilus oryzae]
MTEQQQPDPALRRRFPDKLIPQRSSSERTETEEEAAAAKAVPEEAPATASGRAADAPAADAPAATAATDGARGADPATAGATTATTAPANVGTAAAPHRLDGPADDAEVREQWQRILAEFVDDPRASVVRAEELLTSVKELVERQLQERRDALTAAARSSDNGGAPNTEDQRLALAEAGRLMRRLLTPSA